MVPSMAAGSARPKNSVARIARAAGAASHDPLPSFFATAHTLLETQRNARKTYAQRDHSHQNIVHAHRPNLRSSTDRGMSRRRCPHKRILSALKFIFYHRSAVESPNNEFVGQLQNGEAENGTGNNRQT
jgi:hypothetical protein